MTPLIAALHLPLGQQSLRPPGDNDRKAFWATEVYHGPSQLWLFCVRRSASSLVPRIRSLIN